MTAVAGIVGRLRRAAEWRPGLRGGTRVVAVRCPYCGQMRPAREFRRGGRGCRGCVGTG
ncbi:hypothetical protein [Actinoplanes sp. M2I2]|uniref:hypothetical protein n=1 Tax=Actinoplanes sp. M2I2 TaxID=1734444 RepID=UPI002021328D|nr:hypothetical protein [Actinoplanes sp. M2I2]